MADQIAVSDELLRKLLASVDALKVHEPYWQHFLNGSVPIFLASLLGLATALSLDWLKTRREKKKLSRERLEKELTQLSSANTAIAFNISALIHTAAQQILPHHKQSHKACAAIKAAAGDPSRLLKFDELLHSEFQPMMKRCPDPYLNNINLSSDLPFVISIYPELLLLSGWILRGCL